MPATGANRMRRNAEMTLLADDDLDRPGADMRPAFTASSLGDPTLGDCHRRLVPRCPPRRCHVEPHQNVRPLGRIHCLMTPSNGSRSFFRFEFRGGGECNELAILESGNPTRQPSPNWLENSCRKTDASGSTTKIQTRFHTTDHTEWKTTSRAKPDLSSGGKTVVLVCNHPTFVQIIDPDLYSRISACVFSRHRR